MLNQKLSIYGETFGVKHIYDWDEMYEYRDNQGTVRNSWIVTMKIQSNIFDWNKS